MDVEIWRKKDSEAAVLVRAIRVNEENVEDVAKWSSSDVIQESDPEHPEEMQKGLNVLTPAGIKRASLGMYVIKFGKHFFVDYPRPFEEKYEPATRPAPHPESAGDSRKARGFADPFDTGRFQ